MTGFNWPSLQFSFWKIFWIDASKPEALQLSFKSVASDPDAKAAGAGASAASVLLWLSQAEHEWLLVIDNADEDARMLKDYMPSGNRGNILITSRNKALGEYVRSAEGMFKVEEMNEDDAELLLRRVAKLDDSFSKSSVTVIVRTLHYFPLAIDQAGAFILSGRCHIDKYLDMYQTHRQRLLSTRFAQTSDYEWAAYMTWDLSFASISEFKGLSDPSDTSTFQAAQCDILFLYILAFLHHANIIKDIFQRAAENSSPSPSTSAVNDYAESNDRLGRELLQLDSMGQWDSWFFEEGISVLTSLSLDKIKQRRERVFRAPIGAFLEPRQANNRQPPKNMA